MKRLLAVAIAAIVALIGLTACTSSSGSDAGKSPDAMLAEAKKQFDSAGTLRVKVSSQDVPRGINGVEAAEGIGVIDPSSPKFKGNITFQLGGTPGTADVIAIGETAWSKFVTKDFEEFDLASVNAPNPANMFAPDKGLSTFLSQTSAATKGDDIRADNEILHTVTGEVKGNVVYDLLHLGDQAKQYAITYGITDAGQLRQAVIVGEFFGDATSTFTINLTDYGIDEDVIAPNAAVPPAAGDNAETDEQPTDNTSDEPTDAESAEPTGEPTE